MANVTISDLTAATSLTGTELLEIEQSGTSKRVTADDIAALGGGGGGGTGNDSDDNYSANNFLSGFRSVTTAGVTVTLTVASEYQQYFTGSTTAGCKLPVTSTLTLGHKFFIANTSSGDVTVMSSGLNTVVVLAQDESAMVTCILTSGTSAASWSVVTAGSGGGGASVDDTAYDATSWDGDTTTAPSKNAVRDKIEALVAGGGLGDAQTSDGLDQFAATTSAELKTVISDETGTGSLVFATGPSIGAATLSGATLTGPILGTPLSGTLTNCTGLPVSTGVSGLGTGVATALAVNSAATGSVGVLIATGTAALGTSAIASAALATVVTVAATGVVTTDVIQWTPNADISGVTGYTPSTAGGLVIYAYPTANNVNFKVGNPTTASVTPGAVTLNWRVYR